MTWLPALDLLSFPIPIPPCRDAQPTLSLSYNSANGNGIFGLGWDLSLQHITRKTVKGIPRYRDEDIFIFMGEDLVPLNLHEKGTIISDSHRQGFLIRRYAPRIEGKYNRIERWTQFSDPKQVFWKIITPKQYHFYLR